MTIGIVFRELAATARKNISLSISEGMCFAVMVGMAESYFAAFGVFLGATAFQLAVLAALPPFFCAISQMLSVALLNRFPSRRPILTVFSALQAASILPIAFLPVFAGVGSLAVNWLIVLVVVYWIACGMTAPVWNSLIGDLIPAQYRGRYFGIRNQWMGICTLAATLSAGGVLHLFSHLGGEGTGSPMVVWGYFCIFLIALVARLGSSYFLSNHDNPDYTPERPLPFSLARLIRRAPHSNFAKFVLFVSAIQAGQAFSAPYFAPYMLRNLQLPYFEYSLIVAAPALALTLMHPFWGRLVDKAGCKRVLLWSSVGAAANPILWLVSSNIYFLLGVQLFSGVVWSGFNLAAGAFLFDAVGPSKRAYYAAYQGMAQGIFVLLGSFIGALVADTVPAIGLLHGSTRSPYLLLFLISGIIRLTACLVLLRRFEDGRITAAATPAPEASSSAAFDPPDANRTAPL